MKRILTLIVTLFSAISCIYAQSYAPVLVESAPVPGGVRITWTPVAPSTASGYHIYRNDILIGVADEVIDNEFTDRNPIAGAVVTYCVTSYQGSTESPYRNCIIDSSFYYGAFLASDSASDARIELTWSIDAGCLAVPGTDSIYLEVKNATTNEDVFVQILQADSVPTASEAVVSVALSGGNHLLLDAAYTGGSVTSTFLTGIGRSIAIDGNRAVIGAPLAEGGLGKAHVYERVGNEWVETAQLVPAVRSISDNYGESVDIYGGKIVVGAPGGNGVAYVFELSGGVWTETGQLRADYQQVNDDFAESVVIDTQFALVGAPGKYGAQGVIFLYMKSGSTWNRIGRIFSRFPAPGQRFGYSLDFDGSMLAVGCPGNSAGRGSAYLFQKLGLSFVYRAALNPGTLVVNDRFGESISVQGGRAVVGAPGSNGDKGRVYVFHQQNAFNWPLAATLAPAELQAGDRFGEGVAHYGDLLSGGAPTRAADNGAVYFYRFSSSWQPNGKAVRPAGSAGDGYGLAMDMWTDGLLVGAPYEQGGQSSVYKYFHNGNIWNGTGTIGGIKGPSNTLELWVLRNGPQVGNGALISDDFVSFNMTSPTLDRVNFSTGAVVYHFNYQVPMNRWTHLALVSDSSTGRSRLYANGALVDEKMNFFLFGVERAGFQPGQTPPNQLQGQVRDIRYWSDARTGQEIADNLDQVLTGMEPDLTGYWKVSEGAGNTAADATGNYPPAVYQTGNPAPWVIDSIAPIISGTATEWVGADKVMAYTLNTYSIGFGTPLCPPTKLDTGSTLPYKEPMLVVDSSRPDQMSLSWVNTSEAISFYRVVRDGLSLGLLDSSAVSWTDEYRYGASNTLTNGQPYRYCLVPFSTWFLTNGQPTVYDSICVRGNTLPIDFTAADNTAPTSVDLSWNNMSAFGDWIEIFRDGSFFAQLDSQAVAYMDANPVPGKRHVYEFRLLNDGDIVVAATDTGSILPVGVLAGRVIAANGDYALAGVAIEASAIVDGDTMRYQTVSGLAGDFRMEQVYFGTQVSYRIMATAPAGYNITTPAQNIALSISNPESTNLVFRGDKDIQPTGTQALALTNFQATDLPGQDMIQLSWTYSSPDTTWFKVYRDDELLTILTDTASGTLTTYNDLTGEPGTTYQYELQAYVYDNDSVVTEVSAGDNASLSLLSAVDTFDATVVAGDGTIVLTWAHASTNFDGFVLYRDGDVLDTISAAAAYSFVDEQGIPGRNYTYRIRSFATRNDSTYFSAYTDAVPSPITYPGLLPPSVVAATAVAAQDHVVLSWTYPVTGNANFFGFEVYRTASGNTDTLTVYHKDFYTGVLGGFYQYQYTDYTGVPGLSYEYGVASIKQMPYYASTVNSDTEVYPAVSEVSGVTASTTFTDHVALSWAAGSTNHQGYEVWRNGNKVATLGKSARSYTDAVHTASSVRSFAYTVKAIRDIDGAIYASAGIGATGSTQALPNNGLQIPLNFVASDQYTNHVQLSWQYPPYVLSKFFIYKDGQLIDSLDNSLRFYFDTAVAPGDVHTYAIEGRWMGDISARASDAGRLGSLLQVEGMAQSDEGYGIPGVRVALSVGGIETDAAYTDATGFYRMQGVANVPGTTVTVTASGPNAAFLQPTQQITISAGTDRYVVNFTDTFYHRLILPDMDVATPVPFLASIDRLTNQVELRWNVTNPNYSGFRIFRGLAQAANVPAGQPLNYLDPFASPGFDYYYSIFAYYYKPTGTVHSDTIHTGIFVPKVPPVEGLQALPDFDEDVVKLYWSHPTDKHTYYEIQRNGSVIATVPAGERLFYADTTGKPGYLYRYTVTCYLVNGAGFFNSDPVVVETNFPDVAPITELALTPVPADNRVDVNWRHTSVYYAYALVYRDNEVIDTVYRNMPLKQSLDYWGRPGMATRYAVQSVVQKDNTYFFSDTVGLTVTYPTLYTPVLDGDVAGVDMLTLQGSYLPADGYSGFEFYRDNDQLPGSPRSGIEATFTFEDNDGVPDSSYTYKVRAFKDVDVTYYSPYATRTVAFPPLAPPFACAASDGAYFNHIEITWQHASTANDGFILYRDNAAIDTLPAGARKYKDIVNSSSNSGVNPVYFLRSYKVDNGNWYVSVPSNSDDGYALIQQFSILSSYTDSVAGAHLGLNVAIGADFALGGTGTSTQVAKTYDLDVTGNFSPGADLTPDAASGTSTAFGYDVAIAGTRALVGSPWSWNASPSSLFYRSGEVYVYNKPIGQNVSLDTILRNFNFLPTIFRSEHRLGTPINMQRVESNAWSTFVVNDVTTSVGPADTSIGTGSGLTSFGNQLFFDVTNDVVLNQVTVYPQDTGVVSVTIRPASGGPIYSQNFNVQPAAAYAATVLTLNAAIPPGTGYKIDAQGSNNIGALYRNNGGVSYPYTDAEGVVSITGSSAGGSFYYYFYDWQVTVKDTVGTRVHELATSYMVDTFSATFAVNLPTNHTYGTDIQLDTVWVRMSKNGWTQGTRVTLENVTLEKVGTGFTKTLFSTNTSISCPQDSIDIALVSTGGSGLVSANCSNSVTGVFTSASNFAASGITTNGNYRLTFRARLHDPVDTVANTLTGQVIVDEVKLSYSTLAGGIYANAQSTGAEMGRAVALNASMVAGGGPIFNTQRGLVTTFIQRGDWEPLDTLFAPTTAAPFCSYTVSVNGNGYMDETQWTLRDNTNAVIASGGPYNFGSGGSVTVNTANAPLTFFIETQGTFNDNVANFSIVSNGTVIRSGTIFGGQTRTENNINGTCAGAQFGYSLAMGPNRMIVGMPREVNPADNFGSKGAVYYYELGSDGNWVQRQKIAIQQPGPSDDQFGFSLALSGNTLAVGAKGDDWDANASFWDAGSVSLYEFNVSANTYQFQRKIFNPDNPRKTFEFFGYDIAIQGNLMAIGAPGVNKLGSGAVTNAGAVYLYEKDENGNWLLKQRYFADDAQSGGRFGSSVAISGNTLMIGSDGYDAGSAADAGKVYFIYFRDQIDSVVASDGTEGTKTRIEWVYNGVRTNLNNFNIYRDGVLIAAANPNESFVFDYDGIPGKKYVYQVAPVSLDKVVGVTKGDEGWREENGILDGIVLTFDGQVGVPGINIEAWAMVEGERFSYSTITDQEGKFKIKRMYYSDSTRYFVRAWKPGHEFKKDTMDTEFNLQQFQRTVDPFYDLTAYVVTGVAKYENTDCPIDSMDVTQFKILNDGTVFKETRQTNSEGSYTFNIEPFNTDINRYEYHIAGERYRVSDSNLLDTVYYHWADKVKVLNNPASVGKTTVLSDFVDTTTYQVQLFVQNVCGPIGQNSWQVQVQSTDGCYNELVSTNLNGFRNLYLPPKDYVFRVVGVASPSAQTLPVVDYLKVRPRSLDLIALHESLNGAVSDTLVPMDFVFHVTPNIGITNLTDFLCDDPTLPVVVSTGDVKTYNVVVGETFDGITCPVNEGFLIIRNNASVEGTVQIDYDPATGSFPPYTFTVGSPNIVSPYVKFMFVEYHTESDGFLGSYAVAFLIQGVAGVPGNDIIVTPASENDQVLLPLMILRDPPGDGSFAQIDSGTTFESTLSVQDEYKFGLGLGIEVKTKVFGSGIQLDIAGKVTGGFDRNTQFKVTATTSKTIQTSSDSQADAADQSSRFTGDRADVIVGSGLALQYGIGVEVSVDDTCGVIVANRITTGAEVRTTWIYAVDQIRHLVNEYNRNIENARNGTYTIDTLSAQATEEFLALRRDNWNQILNYHSVKTLPHYAFCDPANFAQIPEPWKSAAVAWRTEGFCTLIGSYSPDGQTFNMDSNIVWDANLIERYNKVRQQVGDIEDYLNYKGQVIYVESLLDQVQLDQAYLSLYGPDAKNITFSGGTSFSEERAITRERGSSFKQKVGGGASIAGQAIAAGKVVTFVGAWVGFGGGAMGGTVLELTEFGVSLKPSFEFEINYEQTQGSTNGLQQKVSYTLADDDPGDQYSVTIVRGAQANHTPYFSLLGGRTSCPTEPGAISRDMPDIQLMGPGGMPVSPVTFNADPDKPFIIPIQLANLNPFGEGRYYDVYLSENSNLNGAIIRVNGQILGYNSVSTVFINPGQPVYAYLMLDRNPYFYDYEDIGIGLRSSCDLYVYDVATFSVHFRHPCSDISISQPYDNWLINGDTTLLPVYLTDYDPYNPKLQNVQLVYRRIGTPAWDTIVSLTADSLRNYFVRFRPTYPVPTYPHVWDISTIPDLTDGDYELMAIANCATSGVVTSNRVRGTIDRSTFRLFGVPQPSDGLLSTGDEISVSFNKAIDCPVSQGTAVYEFRADSANGPLVNASMACFGNKMVFLLDNPLLYEGRMVYATLDGVYDASGNLQAEEVAWSFRVSNNPVYWQPMSIEVSVEKGTRGQVTAMLRNTGAGKDNYQLSYTQAWMRPSPMVGQVLPAGIPITLDLDATNLEVGTYNDVVRAAIAGYTTIDLPVTMHVIKPLPAWNVDPAQYQHSLNVIAINYIDSVATADTNDVITAWVNGTLRGVGKIREVAGPLYRSYLTVYGNAIDAGAIIDFRVWDASRGALFQGHPDNAMTFQIDNTIYGSTPSPEKIWVDTDVDSFRMIPLNQGWTWFSINMTQPDMSVNNILRSISPANGDIIMGQAKSAEYQVGVGWTTLTGSPANTLLDTIRPVEGYMIHLAQADTLLLTGEDALNQLIPGFSGWNLIGYLPQEARPINDAFLTTVSFADGDVLKSQTDFAIYNDVDAVWEGSLTEMSPYQAYKLKLGSNTGVYYRGTGPAGWKVEPSAYEHAMRMMAVVNVFGFEFRDEESMVAAFINGECRGVTKLVYVPHLNRYLAPLFVYSNEVGEEVTFKIWDGIIDTLYDASQRISFNPQALPGRMRTPFVVSPQGTSTGTDAGIEPVQQAFSLQPNPFTEQMVLEITEEMGDDYEVVMYNAIGEIVYHLDASTVKGNNRFVVKPHRKLDAGLYMVVIRNGEQMVQQFKVVKL